MQAAKSGHISAQCEVVKLCLEDFGEINREIRTALKLLEESAKQGDIESNICLTRISSSLDNSRRVIEENEKARQKAKTKQPFFSLDSFTPRIERVEREPVRIVERIIEREPTKAVDKTCRLCNGSGEDRCDSCNGTGVWGKCVFCKGFGFRDFGTGAICRDCYGTGNNKCGQCHGTGRRKCFFCNGYGVTK